MEEAVNGVIERMIEFRRDVHRHPELGFKEIRTKGVLKKELMRIGCVNVLEIAETGLVVDIQGQGGLKHPDCPSIIALRADMDALPMEENNPGLDYCSTISSSAHMCGHDGHMAMLLGACEILYHRRKEIPKGCTVRLLFQPAEEGPGGADKMIEDGCLDRVDEVYGIHNIPAPLGTALVKSGAVMAHSSRFYIKIIGKGGHASMPQACIDPVVAGSNVVLAIQSIVSRNIASVNSVVISCCKVLSGSASNVIPDNYEIWGSIRDFDESDFTIVQQRMKEIVDGISETFGCTGILEINSGYPCVVNHEKETQHVIECCSNILGSNNVSKGYLPVSASEDFSYYLKQKPGCFFFLGTIGKDDNPLQRMCHASNYDFNDETLPIGIKIWISLVQHRFQTSLFPSQSKI